MALPQKHTVNANVQVSGGAARIIALQEAVKLRISSGNRDTENVIATAREFEAFLDGTDEMNKAVYHSTPVSPYEDEQGSE